MDLKNSMRKIRENMKICQPNGRVMINTLPYGQSVN